MNHDLAASHAGYFETDEKGELTWGAKILAAAHAEGRYPDCERCREAKRMSKPTTEEILEWLGDKLAEAEKAARYREQAEQTWRGGTDATWRAASKGMRFPSKAERLANAEMERRIGIKARREVVLFKSLIEAMKASLADPRGHWEAKRKRNRAIPEPEEQ